MSLTWEKDFAPTRALDATLESLLAVAETVVKVPEPDSAGEIDELLGALYTGPAGLVSRGAVRTGLAAGSEAEAALVARFAAEAVAGGTPPERVVVAFPDLSALAPRIQTAFAAEGLACDVDMARPVVSTSLGRSLDALLVLAQGGGDRATAVGVLLGPQSDVSAQTVANLDRLWRRSRVTEPWRLLGDIAKLDGSLLGKAAELVRLLTREPLGPGTGKKWESLVNLLLSAAATRVTAGGESARDWAGALSSDAGVARAVVRAVGEMASVEGSPFSAGDVRAALRTAVAGGTTGERPGHVQVTEIARLRSRRFDVVIVGGLTAAELPAGSPDSLADELRGLFGSEPVGRGEEAARFAFYQAISRARNLLVLVRRDADDRGAPVRPSALWEEVVDAYRVPGENAELWPAAGPPCTRIGEADVASTAPVFTQGRRQLRRQASEGLCLLGSPARGALTDSAVLETLSASEVFSATEVEAYLQCPYRWFYERVVRPEEIDVEVDARAVGTVAHGLLKAFYDALPARLGAARVTPENSEAATRLLESVIDEFDIGIATDGLAEELDLARAARWVQAAVADDAHVLPGFAPLAHEFSFGQPDQSTVALGGVGFRGRIDRIDQSADAVFVTDYKSSRVVSGHAKFADEGKIQAVVYALAAREASGLPVAGSVYRSLRSRQMRGFWRHDLVEGPLALGHAADALDEAGFEELVIQTDGMVTSAVAGIRSGNVAREPANKKTCAFCALRLQCEGATR